MPYRNSALALLCIALLLAGLVTGCGGAAATETSQDAATAMPASITPTPPRVQVTDTTTAFESPLSGQTGDTSAFESPLEEPPVVPESTPTRQVTRLPTGTPDPNRTPVAIAQAEIGPGQEIITIQNVSAVEQDISGWVLFNLESDATYHFPEGQVLQPGQSVQVYSAVSEATVPADALFWTEEKVWHGFPADVMLLNQATRLMFRYTAYGDQ